MYRYPLLATITAVMVIAFAAQVIFGIWFGVKYGQAVDDGGYTGLSGF